VRLCRAILFPVCAYSLLVHGQSEPIQLSREITGP
jgi:hypothetical protein